MNKETLWYCVLSASLVMAIAWEWLRVATPLPPALPAHANIVVARAPMVMPGTIEYARASSIVAARPLFAESRQPSHQVSLGGDGLPRLAGIMITPMARRAIFAEGDKQVVLAEGQELGNLIVRRISFNSVVVDEMGRALTMWPRFDASPATLPAKPDVSSRRRITIEIPYRDKRE